MDYNKIMGGYFSRTSKSFLSKIHNRLIKKLGNVKIDNIEEYISLLLLNQSYYILYIYSYIEVINKENNAKRIIKSLNEIDAFFNDFPLCFNGTVGEWIKEYYDLKKDIKINLTKFLIHPKNTELYLNTILKIKVYCETHEQFYNEWKTELEKYQKGLKKEIVLGGMLSLAVLLGGFSLLGNISQNKNDFETEIIEEQENFDDTSLENINANQILSRKL